MFEWLVKSLTGPLIDGALNAYKAKLSSTDARDKLAVDAFIAERNLEIERRKAQKELGVLAMNHPIWWVAWGLFVIPVGLYNAAIFMVSTLGIPPETFAVLRVPADQRELANVVIQYMFLAQAGLGAVGALLQRLTK